MALPHVPDAGNTYVKRSIHLFDLLKSSTAEHTMEDTEEKQVEKNKSGMGGK